MRLSHSELVNRLFDLRDVDNGRISIMPFMDKKSFSGSSSVVAECRLGRWFSNIVSEKIRIIDSIDHNISQNQIRSFVNRSYIDIGSEYILHPGKSCLAATMEWIVLPNDVAAYVEGKSSLARHQLQIHLAPNIHPSFCGCITLELHNHGDVAISLRPGMGIAQISFERIDAAGTVHTKLGGMRGPYTPTLRSQIDQKK